LGDTRRQTVGGRRRGLGLEPWFTAPSHDGVHVFSEEVLARADLDRLLNLIGVSFARVLLVHPDNE